MGLIPKIDRIDYVLDLHLPLWGLFTCNLLLDWLNLEQANQRCVDPQNTKVLLSMASHENPKALQPWKRPDFSRPNVWMVDTLRLAFVSSWIWLKLNQLNDDISNQAPL